MGIAYKDLKSGRYYKGTLSNGSKVFLFVESVSVSGNQLGVSACRVERKSSSAQWIPLRLNVSPSDDSRMRREVTLSEVQAEGVSRAPLDKGTTPPKPVTTGAQAPSAQAPSAPSAPSNPKPPALRKDGSPKATIPDNARSAVCLHCRKPTRTVALFQFSVQWCSDCEP